MERGREGGSLAILDHFSPSKIDSTFLKILGDYNNHLPKIVN